MKKIIVGLVCMNGVLVCYLALAIALKPSSPREAKAENSVSGSLNGSVSQKPRAGLRAFKRTAQGRFDWQSLATPDLRQFVANLRAVQCPEETIRDIVMAEINRRYGPQERALKVRPEDVPPWETAANFDRKTSEGKLRQLLEEKRALVKELVGVDTPANMPSKLAGRDVEKFESAFNDMTEDKRDLVRAIQEKYWSQSDDIKSRTMGFLEPEDREEFVRIKAERRAELAKVLTPKELEDYEMKTSATVTALRSRMDGYKVSDEEFRKILTFTTPLDEEYSLGRRSPDPEDKNFMAKRTEAETAVKNQMRTVLGDERYADYELWKSDSAYRAISTAGAEAGLPKESIAQVYQAQKLMRDEAQRIAGDLNLTPEQRAQALQGMQLQAQQTMQNLLGDKSAEVMKRLGGGAGLGVGAGAMSTELTRRSGASGGQRSGRVVIPSTPGAQ